MAFKHVFLIILAVIFPIVVSGKDFIVGDETGWTINFDYVAWAQGKDFRVGDKLVFQYPIGVHNVFKVNATGFMNCIVPPLSQALTSVEYMSLPASQYSVLDAESIERVDNSTFRCYVYNFKFFAVEVCPVLLVRVEEKPNGFCIKLFSCKLEGSPIVVAQNEKIDASMVNRVSCDRKQSDSSVAELTSDIVIEVSIEIPFAFRPIPVQAIESTGTQVLEQILKIMLPCFMAQVCDLDIFPL
ncbi:uncharacterized protein LOC114264753 [Camellia sinensis]|uniref:uncharacterized protein LOC114264753 n=1 Tax=Camellia sinensis TaxID=4442 RepID=UPI0010369DF3|nr:uncharacterized protein LOC114264753 [Camellia sinensis]